MSLVDAALSLLASLLLMILVWQDFDPRFLIFFVLGLAFSEFFVLLRYRLSIACPRCGFDPVLYKKDPAKTVERVKAQLARRAQDPMAALAAPLKIAPLVKKKQVPLKPAVRAKSGDDHRPAR